MKIHTFWTEFYQVNSRGTVIDKQLIKMTLRSESVEAALQKLEQLLKKVPRKKILIPSKKA